MANKSSNTKKKAKKITLTAYSWNTTDADEILRRQLRAEHEKFKIANQDPSLPYFSTYRVSSEKSNKTYCVEIRSLQQFINSCSCADYRTNHLGTCKHIETVLNSLKKKGVRKFERATLEGSDCVEIFLDPIDKKTVRVNWPKKVSKHLKDLIGTHFSANGTLLAEVTSGFDKLRHEIHQRKRLRKIRISNHIQYHVNYLKIHSQKLASRDMFLNDVAQGKHSMDLVKYPLLPYQQEGLLHLTFMERALLADEMGLGKTVQAIAACKLLRQLRGIQRVLVVTTASLKSEWEEQIAKFTDFSSLIIFGTRPKRLKQYQENHFFYLMNYEQVISDRTDIEHLLAPDVIILDEAQRIKNWRTKTAAAIKELKSRYAFVLTGTPVENRIDDIYSIVQFLDPHVFGSLFQFNRDFYDLDEEGRPVGYKNLDELYRRLRSIMLCRRKHDVENELPKRLNNNYFIAMDTEQRIRYEEYEGRAARLMNQAKRRPLRKEEFEKLQKWLACMRMICDTPYILDKDCRISPKLNELENILAELLEDPCAKIILFSEWERMLLLVKEMAEENEWQISWHTGSVPQHKRRESIKRFKENTDCRLFLSTDAGSVGLNLQVANVVINLDLPWNPAKLEQRIARAWRKHQKRSVQVINLICENSIEHRMLYLLEQKQLMAKGVLTGEEALKSMKMPSGRSAFMERMESLLVDQTATSSFTANQAKAHINQPNQMTTELDPDIHSVQVYQSENHQQPIVLAVINNESKNIREHLSDSITGEFFLETIDQKTLETIQRLAKTGVLTLHAPMNTLHDRSSPTFAKQRRQRQLHQATQCLNQAERKQRMVGVLIREGFADESMPHLQKAFHHTLEAFLHLTDKPIDETITLPLLQTFVTKENDSIYLPTLFDHLVISDKKHTDIEKLFTDHQRVINYLTQIKHRLFSKFERNDS